MSEVPIGGAHHTAQSILLEELTQGRPICVRCASSSMSPKIVPGDMLTIAPVSLDQIQRGDIVLMEAGEEWIVHRLLAIRKKGGSKYAVTRGDSINRLDAPVPLECILGKVSGIRRDGQERIFPNSRTRRLEAWLALVALQVLDVLRRIKHGRWLVIPHLRAMGLWVAMLSFPPRVKAWGKLQREFRSFCHSRANGNPVPLWLFLDSRVPPSLKELWRTSRGNDMPPIDPCKVGNAPKCLAPSNSLRLLSHPDKKPDINALLLQCSLPAKDNLPELFQVIKAAVGWERFLTIADAEGLSELIYFNSREPITNGLIPSEVSRSLETAYLTTLARNTLFLAKLEQIAHALARLDFIVLKGAYLASHVYASPGLRRFSDIDILVKQADLAEVDLRLAAIGYKCADIFAGPQGNGKTSNFLNSVMYYPVGNEIAIDVHWHLLNSIVSNYINTTMDIGAIWQAARPSTSAGLELCPEHLLIHLAEHALHHSFERLILLRDIAEVIIKFGSALDWNRLVSACRKFNLARPVFYSLLFISSKTSVPVPDTVLDALRPAPLGRAEKLFISFTLRGRRYPELCNLAYFDNMTSCGGKLRFVLRLVFPCREVMALTYNKRVHEIGPGDYILRLSHGIRYLTGAMVHFICRWTTRAPGIQSAGLV